jgi:16S rRNA (guanine527-N7)-methyltransferase
MAQSELSRRLLDGARELGLPISEAQASQLLVYLDCLQRWNAVHSLSAWDSPSDLLVHHVFDSMTVVEPLSRFAGGRRLHVLDAGSGAGFPAAVLAVLRPEWALTAVDAVAKKTAFLRQAAAESDIHNLVGVHVRLERWRPAEAFDAVVSRAFASLNTLVRVTDHLLSVDGIWLAQKGQLPDKEIAGLTRGVEVFHVEPVTVPGLEAQRHLVWMRRARA